MQNTPSDLHVYQMSFESYVAAILFGNRYAARLLLEATLSCSEIPSLLSAF
jgi:hypothetical protein